MYTRYVYVYVFVFIYIYIHYHIYIYILYISIHYNWWNGGESGNSENNLKVTLARCPQLAPHHQGPSELFTLLLTSCRRAPPGHCCGLLHGFANHFPILKNICVKVLPPKFNSSAHLKCTFLFAWWSPNLPKPEPFTAVWCECLLVDTCFRILSYCAWANQPLQKPNDQRSLIRPFHSAYSTHLVTVVYFSACSPAENAGWGAKQSSFIKTPAKWFNNWEGQRCCRLSWTT